MLTSIAYVLLLGLGLGALARLVRLPPLVGMLAAGILLRCGLVLALVHWR